MYMGYWDESRGGPNRVVREVEQELYEKFLNNEPGYGPKDDSKWWANVEAAEIRPTPEMKECPECGNQSRIEDETCISCGHIFLSKKCVECSQDIPQSEIHCRHCRARQVPEEEEPWVCKSCLRRNPPDSYKCLKCDLPRGVEDVLKFEFLKDNSDLIDALSNESLSVKLPSDISMSSLQLKVYQINTNIVLQRDEFRIPSVIHCTANEMHIFLDLKHPLFNNYQDRPEDIISIEVAKWIWQNYQGRVPESSLPLWSLSNLYYLIHSDVWGKRLELDHEEVSREAKDFFNLIGDSLPDLLKDIAPSVYENMDDNGQSCVIDQLHKNNLLHKKDELIESGGYLKYIPAGMIVDLFEKYPDKFFDGKFWNDPYEKLEVPDPETLQKIRKETAGKYHRCLEDMLSFSGYRNPETNYVRKINQTLRMVREHLVYSFPEG